MTTKQRRIPNYTPAIGEVKGYILFIHGMWSNSNAWEAWAKFFAAAGYASYAINLSPRKGNTSILDYVQMVHEAINWIKYHHGITPIVIGHSMGGLIAQRVAFERAIQKLVLLGSAGPAGINNLRLPLALNLTRYFPQILFSKLFQPNYAALHRLVLHSFKDPDIRQGIMDEMQPDSGKAALEIMFTWISKKLAVDNLGDCQTLVIAGKYDLIMPPSIQRAIARKYGYNCKYKEFPHGHMFMLEENSGPLLEYILNWLNKN